MEETVLNRSPLKWVGGKFKLLPTLIPLLPKGKRLIEPFLGGGSLFLNTDYDQYLLNDINFDLINLFKQIRKNVKLFIGDSETYFTGKYNNRNSYYKLRIEFNECKDNYKKAVLFLYLNRHGYNGLCRYNSKGLYNVPFGAYDKPYFPRDELIFLSNKSGDLMLTNNGYQECFKNLKSNDVIYCDPPYVPLNLNGFTQYHKDGFGLKEHQELTDLVLKNRNRVMSILISNHSNECTRELYKDAIIHDIDVRRSVGCNMESRVFVKELIAEFKREEVS